MKTLKFLSIISFILIFISCEEILLEEDISESNLIILAPTNDASVIAGNISFNWESVTDADQYQIQIATPNFANATQIVLDSITSKTTYSKQLKANKYEWRVRALNSAFSTQYFTNKLRVTEVEDFSDKEVELLSPDNNLISNLSQQELSWKSVEGATEYRIQIWNPDINGTIEYDNVQNKTNLSYLFVDGNHTWQVRAQNDTQNTLFFSRTLLIDTNKPKQPVLSSPLNQASLASGKISFSWEREDVPGSIESDSIYVFTDSKLKTLVFKDKSIDKKYEKDILSGTYYWYVQGFDEAGNKSSNSSLFNFNVN